MRPLFRCDGAVPVRDAQPLQVGSRKAPASAADFVAGLPEVPEFILFFSLPFSWRTALAWRRRMPASPAPAVGQPAVTAHHPTVSDRAALRHIEPALEILQRDILALGLPLRSVEGRGSARARVADSLFSRRSGLRLPKTLVLFRSQPVTRSHRHGFLPRVFHVPAKLPSVLASGWHRHQSVVLPAVTSLARRR